VRESASVTEVRHDERALLDLHERSLFTHDSNGRLLLVNEPIATRRAPRFYLGRSSGGNVWRFRDDVSHALVLELDALCREEANDGSGGREPRHRDAFLRVLGANGAQAWSGPAYWFPSVVSPPASVVRIDRSNAELLRDGFEAWLGEVDWQPFVAVVIERRAVAICASVRITATAHAAGVETLPAFRGRGHARAAVLGWAAHVQARGALPIYSTSWSNTASQAVARSLGLVQFGADFHVA
jgi:hypothetical protein